MLNGLINRFTKIAASLDEDKILHDVLEDSTLQAQIIDLNQNQLYEEGLQADGTPTGEYAPITVAYYKPLGAAEGRGIMPGKSLVTSHITGYDTGETYASMKVVNSDKAIQITADDRNGFFDREDKGLGLTAESLGEIKPEFIESIIDSVRKKIAS